MITKEDISKIREFQERVDNLPPGMAVAERAKYIKAKKQIEQVEFRDWLFNRFGVKSHPRRERLFELAWQYGTGLASVYSYFSEMVELLDNAEGDT